MSKKFYFGMLMFLALGLISIGCAKKKVSTLERPEETKTTTSYNLKQEDLTKPTENIKAGSASTEKVSEYSVSSNEVSSKGVKERKDTITLPENVLKELKKRIHFAFDSYELTNQAKEILKKKAEILLNYPSIKLVIEGHCDERGTEEYNLALGERRARAAYEYLVLLGIEADRLNIVSYGEERPLDPRHNEEAWAKNRRDEFNILE